MSRFHIILGAIAGVLSLAALPAPSAESAGAHRVVDRWKLGGAGGWDYLLADADARRIYVSRSDRVLVLDADSGKSIGEIANTSGVHGIALAPGLNRGYTSNGRADSVTVFDLKTLKALAEIKVSGKNPDAILFDPATRHVFTFNGRSANVSVIDTADNREIGTIALGGKPEFAATDGKGRIYVNIEDKNELTAIDASTQKVLTSWPLAGCEEPSGLAFDTMHQRLFSACGNAKMIVTDSTNGKQVASLAIGNGVDAAAFDAQRHLVFSSNGEGTLTIIHQDDADHYRVVDNLVTQKSARTLALDAKTHRLFLPAAEFGSAPAATPEHPHPRPAAIEGSFTILVVGQ
jgi:YVTN family beta-propeller protein